MHIHARERISQYLQLEKETNIYLSGVKITGATKRERKIIFFSTQASHARLYYSFELLDDGISV